MKKWNEKKIDFDPDSQQRYFCFFAWKTNKFRIEMHKWPKKKVKSKWTKQIDQHHERCIWMIKKWTIWSEWLRKQPMNISFRCDWKVFEEGKKSCFFTQQLHQTRNERKMISWYEKECKLIALKAKWFQAYLNKEFLLRSKPPILAKRNTSFFVFLFLLKFTNNEDDDLEMFSVQAKKKRIWLKVQTKWNIGSWTSIFHY